MNSVTEDFGDFLFLRVDFVIFMVYGMGKFPFNQKNGVVMILSEDIVKSINTHGETIGVQMVYDLMKIMNRKNNPLASLLSSGNLKLPTTTAIFNMSSATDCPSLKLGLCKAMVGDKSVCYAMKAELPYRPDVLPYRRRQEDYWKNISAEEFVVQFLMIQSTKKKPYDKIRFNESGDFHDQSCVKKLNKIASYLKRYRVKIYCYTSRDDLDFTCVTSNNLVINGSGFKKAGITNEFKMIESLEDRPAGFAICPKDCRLCDRCSISGKNTVVLKH